VLVTAAILLLLLATLDTWRQVTWLRTLSIHGDLAPPVHLDLVTPTYTRPEQGSRLRYTVPFHPQYL
jgi:hypothetical protein